MTLPLWPTSPPSAATSIVNAIASPNDRSTASSTVYVIFTANSTSTSTPFIT